jgi:hypothetical protein
MKPVRIFALSLGLAWICALFVHSVLAQSRSERDFERQMDQSVKVERNTVQIKDLERRMAEVDALKLSERLARQETTIENAYHLLEGALGGICLLMVEALYRIVRRSRSLGLDRRAPS